MRRFPSNRHQLSQSEEVDVTVTTFSMLFSTLQRKVVFFVLFFNCHKQQRSILKLRLETALMYDEMTGKCDFSLD